ncbi:hypothetical protein BHM03_00029574 [Ensete ventricosum]|nr:hypothetical protein BHM03_00029574 [Ensete ventricosum]
MPPYPPTMLVVLAMRRAFAGGGADLTCVRSAVRPLAPPVYPADYLRQVGHVGGPAVRGCDDLATRMRKKVIPVRCSPATELECGEDRVVAKGYVPVVVGVGKELRRYVVSVGAFKHPCFVGLLDMAAQEFGYQQKGVLRIPCDAQHFEQVFRLISISV